LAIENCVIVKSEQPFKGESYHQDFKLD
jgi:hypothetical protein